MITVSFELPKLIWTPEHNDLAATEAVLQDLCQMELRVMCLGYDAARTKYVGMLYNGAVPTRQERTAILDKYGSILEPAPSF